MTSEIVQRVLGQLIVEPIAPSSSAVDSRLANPIADSDLRPAGEFRPKIASQLTYTPGTQFNLAHWAFTGALISVLLLGGLFLFRSYVRSAEPHQDSPNSSAPIRPTNSSQIIPGTYAADPVDTASGQMLTVVARPEQTLKEISLLYAGHFDSLLFKDICAINPELKDPNHIEAGQLIRIPLPPRTLRKGFDTADITSASEGHSTESRFAKIRAFLVGGKL